ncbi:uncharacterized protein LOC135084549 [Ostrinia nubilalis]|uniref:uncharacterized protein LOC135084549 n=1 Tax=Ostrinia nubilalis TaxID=29057 RepID=UPI00308265C2
MKPVSEESSFSLTEEEKEINKEEFKSRILRMAYGDACLKVVVKKCYKALKLVGKQVCRNIKCKSDFKEKYNQLTRLGCIGQFRVNATTTTTNEPEGNYENNENYDYNQDFTIDPTRSGLEACYPLMETKHVTLRNETPHQTLDLRVDILRDRFERACQQASRAKCNDACKFAYQGACDEYECTKAKKKAFAKRCKAQCKAAYIIKKEKEKDSSDSSSDSDSESDSSDSDSDDWKV